MDRIDSYLSGLIREIENDLIPSPRFESESERNQMFSDRESISKPWDQMTHEERNRVIYGLTA